MPRREVIQEQRAALQALIDAGGSASEPEGAAGEPAGVTFAEPPASTETLPAASPEPPATTESDLEPGGEPDLGAEAPAPAAPRKGTVWDALKAQKERSERLEGHLGQQAELLQAINQRLEQLNRPPPGPEVEPDPDVQAWNSAFKDSAQEFVTPEIQALRKEAFEQRLHFSQQLAATRHADYFDVVNLEDASNPVARYLVEHPTEARTIGQERDVGERLYRLGLELREFDPVAKEAWREAERARIRAEEKAAAQKELRALMAKGGAPPRADSIASAPGAPASTSGAVTTDMIGRMNQRQLEDLIQRAARGESIESE